MDLQQDHQQGQSQSEYCPLPQSRGLDWGDKLHFLVASLAQVPTQDRNTKNHDISLFYF